MVALNLFCSVRKYFEALGFYAPPQPNQNCELNRKNLFYISSVTGLIFPVTGFLLFKATSAFEYSMCFYTCVTMLGMTVYCTVLIYKMGSIVKLIENYGEFIGKRKSLIF